VSEKTGNKTIEKEMFEKDGVYYTTEKARDFFHEMMRELSAVGWDFIGDVTLRGVKNGQMIIEGRVQRIMPAPKTPQHVCGKRGFGIGPEGHNDVCLACEENIERNRILANAKRD